MKKQYFKLQLKSILKIYPSILLITFLTIFSIVVTGFLVFKNNENSDKKKKIEIGIVGNLENSYLDIGLTTLKNYDSSKYYFEFNEYDEASAVKALKSRRITGYIHIPEGFVENIYNRNNAPAKYVTLTLPDSLGSTVAQEITRLVSEIVKKSQFGMYAMQDISRKYDVKDRANNTSKLTGIYIKNILSRNELYNVKILGVMDTLSFEGYYICGFIMLFLLLWGIFCNKLFLSKKIALSKTLKAYGMRTYQQILCEYLGYCVITIATMLVLFGAIGVFISNTQLSIRELQSVTFWECIFFVFLISPVIIMITLMQTAFYEMLPNSIAAVIMQFLLSIGLGYICGCFYPSYFFPKALQSASYYLPVGVGFSFIRKILAGVFLAKDFILIAVYIIFFTLITIFARNRRMAGEK